MVGSSREFESLHSRERFCGEAGSPHCRITMSCMHATDATRSLVDSHFLFKQTDAKIARLAILKLYSLRLPHLVVRNGMQIRRTICLLPALATGEAMRLFWGMLAAPGAWVQDFPGTSAPKER